MMRISRILVLTMLFAVACTSVFAQTSSVSETGKTGMSFLGVTPTSRTASLGGLTPSTYTGASSIWSNPSLIALRKQRWLEFTHTEWIEGIRQEYASIITPISAGHLGFGVQMLDSGDIELRGDSPSSGPLGTYSIKNVAFSFTYARALASFVTAGATYKMLFEKVSDENANGYAIDAGLTFKMPVDGLYLSTVARNYGRMEKLQNDRTKLPSDVIVGGMYETLMPRYEVPLRLLSSVVFPRFGDNGFRGGIELEPLQFLALRLGYRSDSDIETMSYGVGVMFDRFNADVSYTPMQEGFDSALRVSLSITGF